MPLARTTPLATLTPPVTFSARSGVGFMLIEISQMQRLMVFLGIRSRPQCRAVTICCLADWAAPRSARVRPTERGHCPNGRMLASTDIAGLLTPA